MTRAINASRMATLLGDFPRSPAYRGLTDALRRLIVDGRVAVGVRLPSERELTDALPVSRTTVARAYAELREQGYLVSRLGSGSVAALPQAVRRRGDHLLHPGLDLDENTIDLTCSAAPAAYGVMAAYEDAMTALPSLLTGTGYAPTGLPELREQVAASYDARGLATDPDQIIVVPGALSAMAVALRAVARTGDRAILESPTYPNIIETTQRAGVRIVGTEVTSEGWDTAAMAATIRQVAPRFVYTIPDFHNPTGALMSTQDRERVAQEINRARATAIIDESLSELGLDADVLGAHRPAPLASLVDDAITLGSASKSHWGGLRVGWLRVPRPRLAEVVRSRLSLDLGTAPLEQLVTARLLASGAALLDERRATLRAGRDTLRTALAAAMPDWRVNAPRGGMSLWCELPEAASTALAVTAERHGVLLPAGPSFAPEGGLDRFVRIPYTAAGHSLEQAAARLAQAWREVTEGGTADRITLGGVGRPLVA